MTRKMCDENTCPIGQNVDFSRSTAAEKTATAEALYSTGKWTMARIAERIGVAERTVSRWLGCFNSDTVSELKQPKSASNPKGAGRPKGSKKRPESEASKRAASLVLDGGRTNRRAAAEVGLSHTAVEHARAREEGRREGAEASSAELALSMSAKEKLDAAIRHRTRQLEQEFEGLVSAEVERRIAAAFPHLKEAQRKASAILSSYSPRFTKSECNDVARVLHPDTWNALAVPAELQQRLTRAFVLFSKMQGVLCIERGRASA